MKLVNDFPPNMEELKKTFLLSGREIFAYGDTVYNPGGFDIPAWLMAHEEVHQKQQGDNVEGWWARYLIDVEFRYQMELEAHQREYESYCYHNKDRNAQTRYRSHVAKKLAAPLYGSMVSVSEAKRALR
jgi:hypothetical protein